MDQSYQSEADRIRERREACEALGIEYELMERIHAPGRARPDWLRPADLGDLDSRETKIVNKLLNPQVRAARGLPPTALVSALLHKVRTGFSGWRGLPGRYGPPDVLRQRHVRWLQNGTWMALLAAVPGSVLSEPRKQEFERLRQIIAEDVRRRADRR